MSTWRAAGGKWEHLAPRPALRARDVVVGGVYETVAEIERTPPVVDLDLLRVVCVDIVPADERSRNTRFLMVELGTGIPLLRAKRAEDLAELVPVAGPRGDNAERRPVRSFSKLIGAERFFGAMDMMLALTRHPGTCDPEGEDADF